MAKRLIKWFTFTIAFALIPLGATLLLRYLLGVESGWPSSYAPELLFFSLMASATALGDLSEVNPSVKGAVLVRSLFSILLLGAIAAGILYGSLVFAMLTNTDTDTFSERTARAALLVTIIYGVFATLVEILIGRIEETG